MRIPSVAVVAWLAGTLASGVAAQTITEYPIPTADSYLHGITAGPDGNLWFIESAARRIGRITPAGVVTEFPLPAGLSEPTVVGIVAGPDGNLWFPELILKKVGRMTTDGVLTEFPVDLDHPYLSGGITVGPDGALWFTENSGFFNPRSIGRITTDGSHFSVKVPAGDVGPYGIAAGPDGAIWYTVGNMIQRVGPTAIWLFWLGADRFPSQITPGPDGNLWYTGSAAGTIGRITTRGAIKEFPTPGSDPAGITAGPDGNIWFTESNGNRIGRITPAGIVQSFPIPTASSTPIAITAGPDGAMWFTEGTGNKIGRITTGAGTPPNVLSIDPPSGPAAGGTDITITGSGFLDGAQVWIGELSASAVLVVDGAMITATTPALPPGTLANVVVTNPDKASGTLRYGWFADFSDVPPAHLFHAAIEKIVRAGITTGCGSGNYCPEDPVNRAAMAIFILRGKHGDPYFPPAVAPPTVFSDVSSSTYLWPWIDQFGREGISTGCGGGNYCPKDPVTRDGMAVFLLRGKNGSSFQPPAATGTVFGDVTTLTYLAKWMEALKAAGITQGCGAGNYCPTGTVKRGEMAAFIRKAFDLP
jgi:streptogramin lyase